jgi:hypothetical protein
LQERPEMRVALIAAYLLLVQGAAYGADERPTATPAPRGKVAEAQAAQESIGVATMEADGTIVLRLIARGPGGMRGEGVLRYPVSDPKYRDILDHVGSLKPGETRPVAPWPD